MPALRIVEKKQPLPYLMVHQRLTDVTPFFALSGELQKNDDGHHGGDGDETELPTDEEQNHNVDDRAQQSSVPREVPKNEQ